ncbi:MAG: VCBS repeat-containing protein, partial [bacterium]|nr:VCBS repeat-containing protein [bacterium]
MKPALLIMFCLSWVFCPVGAYPDWPYLYGDLAGRSVLPVEPLKSHTLDFLVQDSRPIPTDLSDLRAADVDGDSYPEIMGVSLDGQELWVIDYFAQDMRVPNITGGIIHLAGLLDYDGDGSSDILFTQQAAGEPAWHRIFSVQQQKFLMQIEDRSGYEIIQAVTVLDFDFDGSDDLLVSRYAADRESSLVLMDVNSGEERAQIHIPGRPFVAQMALIQHEEFQETLLFFVTAPYPGANKKMVFYLQGY